MKRIALSIGAVAAAMVLFAGPASAISPTFFPYSQPGTPAVPSYTDISCAIDLSSIPDFSTVTSVTGCGTTVTFSTPMVKVTVGQSWGTWGSAPDTEGSTPAALWSNGATSVTLTYGGGPSGNAGRRTVGVEAEPNLFGVQSVTATFTAADSSTAGTVTRDIDGNSGARLLAARTKTIPKTTSMAISSSGDFAIAQIRV